MTGGGDRLEDSLSDFQPGLVGAGDDALLSARRTGGDVQVDFEPISDHPDGVMDSRLLVEDELLRKQMNELTLGRKRNGARTIDRGTHIFAGNLAHP